MALLLLYLAGTAACMSALMRAHDEDRAIVGSLAGAGMLVFLTLACLHVTKL